MSALRRFIPLDPFLIGLLIAVGLAIVLPAKGEAISLLDALVYAAIFALFFLYGARLKPEAVLAGITHWRLQLMVLASTFVLFPLLGIGLVHFLGSWLSEPVAVGLLFLTLVPSTVQSSIAFTSIAGGNVPAALCSASASSFFGIFLTPALVSLLLSSKGVGLSTKAIEDLVIQILVPFVLGQVLRPWIGAWIGHHKAVTSFVDRGSILLVVYAAFSAGMVNNVWTALSLGDLGIIFAADTLLLCIVLAATTYTSRWLGFAREDEIVIVFCGSKKSIVSGIPMANILFAGQAVTLAVLPLMLFHQIQLFICAIIAQHYARGSHATPAKKPIVQADAATKS
ncbi:bile acid:sodium symporter family protein [Beijerinckia indica]|uniref:Bile acid:sodium symporter n=1 Tax=Beijerinckia indica subsp. indica (strain ATCC 9039 / DSM 1715 / NCIMB 8712) TaxID=395963 RepID=B2IHJ5_BEII9|nr:bile acid:sodium symporter family protein [Beijerinckia indica]ACB94516.1 Bile acid:sodium symporter [Beijerinckia indica subsp. indica ATCC 9039]